MLYVTMPLLELKEIKQLFLLNIKFVNTISPKKISHDRISLWNIFSLSTNLLELESKRYLK